MSSRNKRIAHNTLMLYIRMILVMGITLYTSRIVLKELGVENYGIYNVVGGVVAMFNLLVGSLRALLSDLLHLNWEKVKTDSSNVFFLPQ